MDSPDKYTIKLPGRSVLVFLAVASGVFVVYFFTSRVNDSQADANRKSDLVWLQKILDEKKPKPSHHLLGKPAELKHHFYDADVYDYDDYPEGSEGDDWEEDFAEDSEWNMPDRKKIIAPSSQKLQRIRNPGKAWSHFKNLLETDKENRKSGTWNIKADDVTRKVSEENDENIQEVYSDKSHTQESSKDDYVDSQARWKTVTDTISSNLVTTSPIFMPSTKAAKKWLSKLKSSQVDFYDSEESDSADENRSETKAAVVPHRNWPLSKYVNYKTLYAPLLNRNHLKGTEPPIVLTTKADIKYHQINKITSKLPLAGTKVPTTKPLPGSFKAKSRLSIDKFLRKDDGAHPQNEQLLKEQKYPTTNTESNSQTDFLQDNANVKDNIAELKKHIHYPEYMHVFDWYSISNLVTKPECVPLQTVSSYVRVCIHSAKDDPEVSAALKSRSSWEFNSMRDIELAILKDADTGLIDIGAGIGEYSLAAASLRRHVLAVEPYQPNIDLFQKSVHLNKLEKYITLLQNIISDKQEQLMMHKNRQINEVIIQSPTEEQISNNNFTWAITLNQLADVVPFKKAVMKIDIPKFTRKALSQADKLFEKVDVKYVFIHWKSAEETLNKFVTQFFTKIGYVPLTELFHKKLDIDEYEKWNYPTVVWAKAS